MPKTQPQPADVAPLLGTYRAVHGGACLRATWSPAAGFRCVRVLPCGEPGLLLFTDPAELKRLVSFNCLIRLS